MFSSFQIQPPPRQEWAYYVPRDFASTQTSFPVKTPPARPRQHVREWANYIPGEFSSTRATEKIPPIQRGNYIPPDFASTQTTLGQKRARETSFQTRTNHDTTRDVAPNTSLSNSTTRDGLGLQWVDDPNSASAKRQRVGTGIQGDVLLRAPEPQELYRPELDRQGPSAPHTLRKVFRWPELPDCSTSDCSPQESEVASPSSESSFSSTSESTSPEPLSSSFESYTDSTMKSDLARNRPIPSNFQVQGRSTTGSSTASPPAIQTVDPRSSTSIQNLADSIMNTFTYELDQVRQMHRTHLDGLKMLHEKEMTEIRHQLGELKEKLDDLLDAKEVGRRCRAKERRGTSDAESEARSEELARASDTQSMSEDLSKTKLPPFKPEPIYLPRRLVTTLDHPTHTKSSPWMDVLLSKSTHSSADVEEDVDNPKNVSTLVRSPISSSRLHRPEPESHQSPPPTHSCVFIHTVTTGYDSIPRLTLKISPGRSPIKSGKRVLRYEDKTGPQSRVLSTMREVQTHSPPRQPQALLTTHQPSSGPKSRRSTRVPVPRIPFGNESESDERVFPPKSKSK